MKARKVARMAMVVVAGLNLGAALGYQLRGLVVVLTPIQMYYGVVYYVCAFGWLLVSRYV